MEDVLEAWSGRLDVRMWGSNMPRRQGMCGDSRASSAKGDLVSSYSSWRLGADEGGKQLQGASQEQGASLIQLILKDPLLLSPPPQGDPTRNQNVAISRGDAGLTRLGMNRGKVIVKLQYTFAYTIFSKGPIPEKRSCTLPYLPSSTSTLLLS